MSNDANPPRSYLTPKPDDELRLDEWWKLSYRELAGAIYASIDQRDAFHYILRAVLTARAAEESHRVALWTMYLAVATAALAVAAVVSLFLD